MRSKLNYLIGVSLKRKVKTKWFLIANIILALVIICLINIDSIINFFGGDFNSKTNIYVVDNTNYTYDLFKEQLLTTNKTLYGNEKISYEVIKSDKNIDELKELIKTNEEEFSSIVLEFNLIENKTLTVKMLTKEYLDYMDTSLLDTALNNTKISLSILNSGIPVDTLNDIYSNIEIERLFLEEHKNSEDENIEMLMNTIFPILILPLFMLTMFIVQMVGAEVNDEKTTRGMEIIISNVSPKTHFFSKIIASNLFVLLQSILLIVFAVIGFFLRNKLGGANIVGGVGTEVTDMISSILSSSVGSSLIYIIPLTIILAIFTFVGYSALAAILASMTTNIEDFQQLQTPIVVISLVGYYLSMMAGAFDGATFIKVLSFVPFISSILSPSLLVLGQIGIVEVVISTLIMFITNYLLIKYGLKIYKVGILNYSSKDLWKKMFKALKD